MTTDRYPEIEIISLAYNSRRFLDGYFEAFSKIHYPLDRVRLNIIDNGSKDDSADYIERNFVPSSSARPQVILTRSEKNLGFTGGNNLLMRRLLKTSHAPFFLLLNIDTEIHEDTLSKLVQFMNEDPEAGMVEARQVPKEHPKWYDPQTLETGWCSGGGVLIRTEALREVGVFDDRFFLYCEDVDLSWRMWLHGWKCKINPEAEFSHFTETLDVKKDPSVQRFYSMRNSVLMHYKYDSWAGIRAYKKLFFEAIEAQPDEPSKELLWRAYRESKQYIPGVLLDRLRLSLLPKSPWIYFNGFYFERRREFVDTEDGKRIILSA